MIFTDKHNFPNHQSQKILPINQIFDKIWEKFETSVIHFHEKLSVNSAKCLTTASAHDMYYRYYSSTTTVLLHCPITSLMHTLSHKCSNQAGDNHYHIPKFWYSCNKYSNRTLCYLIHNGKFIIIIVIKKLNSHFYDHSIPLRWSQTPLGPGSSLAFQDSICRKSDLHMQHNKWNRRDKT